MRARPLALSFLPVPRPPPAWSFSLKISRLLHWLRLHFLRLLRNIACVCAWSVDRGQQWVAKTLNPRSTSVTHARTRTLCSTGSMACRESRCPTIDAWPPTLGSTTARRFEGLVRPGSFPPHTLRGNTPLLCAPALLGHAAHVEVSRYNADHGPYARAKLCLFPHACHSNVTVHRRPINTASQTRWGP